MVFGCGAQAADGKERAPAEADSALETCTADGQQGQPTPTLTHRYPWRQQHSRRQHWRGTLLQQLGLPKLANHALLPHR